MTTSFYLLLKTLHIVAIISWMAGLLYFYRLFVYHKEFGQGPNSSVHQLLVLMETRLYKFITIPAMIVSVATGLGMAAIQLHYFYELWFQIKMVSVLLLILVTLNGIVFIRKFKSYQTESLSSVQLRMINEIPTILMIIAVAMVIFRPR
jgi:protoporphyrinogen IX oxidase